MTVFVHFKFYAERQP